MVLISTWRVISSQSMIAGIIVAAIWGAYGLLGGIEEGGSLRNRRSAGLKGIYDRHNHQQAFK